MRQRMEEGLKYAREHAYIDYGKDILEMAIREQGIKLKQIDRSEIDVKPPKDVEERISKVLKHKKPKSKDHIPIGFHGKGPKGYLIKEMIVRRGRGSRRVSQMFQLYCHHKDFNPQILPDRVQAKIEMGPRLASLKYRF